MMLLPFISLEDCHTLPTLETLIEEVKKVSSNGRKKRKFDGYISHSCKFNL
eukprot:TRINITY_DN3244_c0_g3_i1.p1 TRINITY_DN3244_c0_g3~~TRINITY_DN3244_c0_g3_i1.p1  ORF type:complete len:51 (+),score=5.41 TRINITY_DN3244_c0_g3_i1:232-384(+)